MKLTRMNGIGLLISLSLILPVCLIGQSVQATSNPVSYSHLSLNPTVMNLEANSSESIQALVVETKVPHTQIKEITLNPHITWSTSNGCQASITSALQRQL